MAKWLKIGGVNMFELRALISFNYAKYDDLVEIKSEEELVKGKVLKDSTIVVKTKEEMEYLCGNNTNRVVACELVKKITKKNKEELEEKQDEIKEEEKTELEPEKDDEKLEDNE
jgi:hypothetical protein